MIATHRDNIKAAEVMSWARAQKDPITPEVIDKNLHSITVVQYMHFDLYFISSLPVSLTTKSKILYDNANLALASKHGDASR